MRLSGLALLAIASVACATAAPGSPHAVGRSARAGHITLRGDGAAYTIDPSTVAIESDGATLTDAMEPASAAVVDEVSDRHARFRLPALDLAVDAAVERGALRVRVSSSRAKELAWPRPPSDGVRALALPIDEGLYLPATDPFWAARFREEDCRTAYGGLSMPFFGLDRADSRGTAYVIASDIGTRVCVGARGDALAVVAKHAFSVRDGSAPYEIVFAPTDGSPIGAALAYRDWLRARGGFVSLAEKTATHPRAERLRGAIHAYLWGDGGTCEGIDELAKLGVTRALLAFDDDERRVTPDVVSCAEGRGYLMARYDTLDNVQDPAS